MTSRPGLYAILLVMGAGWGGTIALTKIAVSTGHQPFGLIFWQLVITVFTLGGLCIWQGRRITFSRRYWRLYIMVAMFGAVLPDVFFYLAATGLPGGILAVIISTAPMFSLPIALALGIERFYWPRFAGLLVGFAGIVLLIGPEASLPEGAILALVPVALLAPLFYATEGNLVAKWGTQGLNAVQVLLGASILGVVLTLPLAVASGQWIDPAAGFGVPEAALVAGAVIHALTYAVYVWLVGQAGSVFAAQTSYVVTIFGVIWSMLLLSESYSAYIWGALALMLAGLFLVQPRVVNSLAPDAAIGDGEPRSIQDTRA